tara:strand:- start:1691 stop:2470 length:780 start_codon:yes stop_codon:yes gene_type:complete
MSNLTSKEFWDSYWSEISLPCQVDLTLPFERCLTRKVDYFLARYLADKKNASIFEVGCAPGKWLAYLSRKHLLNPCGVEYLEQAHSATVRNLESLNLPSKGIIKSDFFEVEPHPIHDIVISLGFIEHFDNVDNVIERHLHWLKPGGLLVLGVPNFSNLNGVIQKVLNKNVLDYHNTEIMKKEYFNHIADKFNLNPEFIDYLGSFEPVMFIGDQSAPNKLQFTINISLQVIKKIRKFKFCDHLNSPLFSSYILSIYRKSA